MIETLDIPKVKVLEHIGHELTVAQYGDDESGKDLAIECTTCQELLVDSDIMDALCTSCKGSGTIVIAGQHIHFDCPACHGTGVNQ